MNVHVIGRPGSDYRKKVDEWLGNVPLDGAQCVFNYGLQGERLEAYLNRHPRIINLPNLNLHQFGNKYECVKAVLDAGMSAPQSWKYRDRPNIIAEDKLIVKPYYSLGGRGIRRIENYNDITDEERVSHYLQEEITNRRYELRCLAASWIDPQDWLFLKRVHDHGEAELAWNHHNGGRFITVRDPSDALFERVRRDVKEMLPLLEYQFGAVDFIIQNNPGGKLNHYFIEWNLAPGWSMESTSDWFHRCFKTLKTETLENIECYEHGLLLEDVNTLDNNRHFGAPPVFPEPPNDWVNDFAHVHLRMDDEEEPLLYHADYTPDGVMYADMGHILVDTGLVSHTLQDLNYSENDYVKFRCRNGHALVVKAGLNYDGFCPACGAGISVRLGG